MSPLLLQNMAHSYPYMLYIANAKRLVQIRYKAWRFLTAFLIVLIFVPLNGGYMRAYMAIYGGIYELHGSSNGVYMGAYMGHMGAAIGHVYSHTWPYMGAYMGQLWGQQWGMYARIYGHIWGSPIGRAGRKGIVGKGITPGLSLPFPSPSSREGNGREGNPYPIPQRNSYIIILILYLGNLNNVINSPIN